MVDFRNDNVGTYYMCKVTHRPTRVMLLNKSKNPTKRKLYCVLGIPVKCMS